ncbi:MAG TPA: metallophosphoesterase family protein [Gaiellaceae bacterium]|nr:metallophosphoesterase family protein [Gaiellaceae bacterium]
MRVAVVSDIHSNLCALEAVLAAIEADAPDELWCLGDIVGYGPRPNECCAIVAERADVCLAGNHDLAIRGTIDLDEFHGDAALAARLNREAMTLESHAFLDRLEPQGKAHGVALYHGSARDPVWEYVLSDEAALATLALAGSPLVLVGHSHVALHLTTSAGEPEGGLAPAGTTIALDEDVPALLNPGSVGQPRDGDPRAAYLLLDLAARRAEFRRVAYDVARTQSEMAEAGLPRSLASRLALGQ